MINETKIMREGLTKFIDENSKLGYISVSVLSNFTHLKMAHEVFDEMIKERGLSFIKEYDKEGGWFLFCIGKKGWTIEEMKEKGIIFMRIDENYQTYEHLVEFLKTNIEI